MNAAMTLLLLFVVGTVLLAVIIDIAAALGWLARRWRAWR